MKCLRCNGKGTYKKEQCYYCAGQGILPSPLEKDNMKEILNAITINKKNKVQLRKSPPNKLEDRFCYKGARAYYVWRLARFHGGADVTMPVCAVADVMFDPYKNELDMLAEAVARIFFGTDMAAAYRWVKLFGWVDEVHAGLHETAYERGPVAEDKPLEEFLELL